MLGTLFRFIGIRVCVCVCVRVACGRTQVCLLEDADKTVSAF